MHAQTHTDVFWCVCVRVRAQLMGQMISPGNAKSKSLDSDTSGDKAQYYNVAFILLFIYSWIYSFHYVIIETFIY